MNAKEHAALHHRQRGHALAEMKCPNCKKLFVIRRGQTYYVKKYTYTCCSPHCRGKFSSRIQYHGITKDVELAISENLVREFSSVDSLTLGVEH